MAQSSLEKEEVAKLKTTIRSIGTPFNKAQNDEVNDLELIEIYNFAKRNKIGLFFLESVPEKLVVGELHSEFERQKKYFKDLRETTIRIAKILNETAYRYAIIKSYFPFPAVPNDVDLIIFENNADYNDAVKIVNNNCFEILHEAPLEFLFHDQSRGVKHLDPSRKDAFDVDVYKEISSGHVTYMKKGALLHQLGLITMEGEKISILKPPAEIAIGIFHSIFPERIFTLLLYYQILYAIRDMSEEQIGEFIRICADHRIRTAARITLSLSESVHEICFGEPLPELVDLRAALGDKIPIMINKLPYNYSVKMVFDSFWDKRNDLVFTFSVFREIISMLNPKYAKYIISVYNERRKRDTY